MVKIVPYVELSGSWEAFIAHELLQNSTSFEWNHDIPFIHPCVFVIWGVLVKPWPIHMTDTTFFLTHTPVFTLWNTEIWKRANNMLVTLSFEHWTSLSLQNNLKLCWICELWMSILSYVKWFKKIDQTITKILSLI